MADQVGQVPEEGGSYKMLACICVVPFSSDICDIKALAVSSSPPFAPARAASLSDDWHIHVGIYHQPRVSVF